MAALVSLRWFDGMNWRRDLRYFKHTNEAFEAMREQEDGFVDIVLHPGDKVEVYKCDLLWEKVIDERSE